MYAIELDDKLVTRPNWAAPKDRAKVTEKWVKLNAALKAAGHNPNTRFSDKQQAVAELERLRKATGIKALVISERYPVGIRVL